MSLGLSDIVTVYAFVSDCNAPPTSYGVTSNFTTTTHGSSVEYSCSYGYETMGGYTILECDSGVWLDTPLTCSLIGKKLRITGRLLETLWYENIDGDVQICNLFTKITLKIHVGLIGDFICTVHVAKCSYSLFLLLFCTCSFLNFYLHFLDCLSPPIPIDVVANYTSTTHGSIIGYSCLTGYEVISGDSSVECDNGSWIGTPLNCSIIGNSMFSLYTFQAVLRTVLYV